MHNVTFNIIDQSHFAVSLRVTISLYLYGDGRCSSYLTGIRKQAMRLIQDLGVIHCDVEAIVK